MNQKRRTITLTPAHRLMDSSPDAHAARYNPRQYGIAHRMEFLYEHEAEIPREYDGRLEFGGTFLRGDLNRTKAAIRAWLGARKLIGRAEPVLINVDIESTPENWEQLKLLKPLAAAAVLEDMGGDEAAAAAEHARLCFLWHSAVVHYIRRLVPGALVTLYNAPWMHRARESPGHFARYNALCDFFAPCLYAHPAEAGIARIRHASQLAQGKPVFGLIYPDDIDLGERYFAHGAHGLIVWSTMPPDFYAQYLTSPTAQRLARWPIEERMPA